ncbi:uncharacterized protein LOC143124778 [Alosa pseudoharengus]|uniref:uncharacterized protein LOC143124778 n=1 Tax=Alosa pseudoharengus TaxID=34774 RepID=UPI003F8BADD9
MTPNQHSMKIEDGQEMVKPLNLLTILDSGSSAVAGCEAGRVVKKISCMFAETPSQFYFTAAFPKKRPSGRLVIGNACSPLCPNPLRGACIKDFHATCSSPGVSCRIFSEAVFTPSPPLFLSPPANERLPRSHNYAPETCQPACEAEPSTPKFRDAQTQWEDPSHVDHTYCSTTPSVKVDKATQCEAEMGPTMTLIKLKLNLILGDIAHRFNVSTSMASIVISHWIDVMGEQFKVLIPWLPRETIRATMPLSFQRNYPRTTCIIDCAESAMQRATNHDSRSDTFSQYKSRNTVKYLVAVAPNGLIMFISDAYAGRSSDKFITMDSGFLDYLRAGDEVMADRGFTIRDLLDERRVSLNIPAFTYRRNQLTNEETTRTRRVANVRIHVERAIQRLKVFKILSQTVPISMAPKLDNILTICAGLVNLKSPLIRVPREV